MERRRRTRREDVERTAVGALRRRAQHGRGSTGRRTRREDVKRTAAGAARDQLITRVIISLLNHTIPYHSETKPTPLY